MRKKAPVIALLMLLVFCLAGCGESAEAKYSRAQQLLAEEKTEEAVRLFDELGDYEDASRLAAYGRAVLAGEAGNYQSAISAFSTMGDYRDCPMMAIYYSAREYESQASDTSWSAWVHAADTYDRVALFRDSQARAAACRQAVYDGAVHYAETKQYDQSVEMLGALRDYQDSAQLKQYYYAFSLEQENRFSEAAEVFKQLGRYKDSEEQKSLVRARGYAKADAEERAGNREGAWRIFLDLGDYSDAFERACKPYYELGLKLREEQNWVDAAAAFEHAGTYSDAETQVKETRYLQAIDKREKENWDDAIEIFTSLGGYKDSATVQIDETNYQRANKLEEGGDQEGAYRVFISLGRYRDSFERACKPYYDLGVSKREAGEWDAAVEAFEKAGLYSDAKTQISETRYQEAAALEAEGKHDEALNIYRTIVEYRDAAAVIAADLNLTALSAAEGNGQ